MLLATFTTETLAVRDLPAALRATAGHEWHLVLSSEAPGFGGDAAAEGPDWTLRGPGALWLAAKEKGADAPQR
jgi:hypothetical protein